jgi:uncharacterized protein YpmS
MWRKAFIALLSLNLLIIVIFTLWWGSLPKASQVQPKVNNVAQDDKTATIQLAIGEDAINAYLEYALSDQQDMQKVLSYARVKFDTTWDLQVGIKLSNRVVPSDIQIQPTIQDGNLHLKVLSATMGELPIPISGLFFVFNKLPWPSWITVDPDQDTLHVNFTARPQHPYGIQILDYSQTTKLLTLRITILPKTLLQH